MCRVQLAELTVPRPSRIGDSTNVQPFKSLVGVGWFKELRVLKVPHHSLVDLHSLEAESLRHLQELDVSHNSLRKLNGLSAIALTLRRFNAGYNYISKLTELSGCNRLVYLNLEGVYTYYRYFYVKYLNLLCACVCM